MAEHPEVDEGSKKRKLVVVVRAIGWSASKDVYSVMRNPKITLTADVDENLLVLQRDPNRVELPGNVLYLLTQQLIAREARTLYDAIQDPLNHEVTEALCSGNADFLGKLRTSAAAFAVNGSSATLLLHDKVVIGTPLGLGSNFNGASFSVGFPRMQHGFVGGKDLSPSEALRLPVNFCVSLQDPGKPDITLKSTLLARTTNEVKLLSNYLNHSHLALETPYSTAEASFLTSQGISNVRHYDPYAGEPGPAAKAAAGIVFATGKGAKDAGKSASVVDLAAQTKAILGNQEKIVKCLRSVSGPVLKQGFDLTGTPYNGYKGDDAQFPHVLGRLFAGSHTSGICQFRYNPRLFNLDMGTMGDNWRQQMPTVQEMLVAYAGTVSTTVDLLFTRKPRNLADDPAAAMPQPLLPGAEPALPEGKDAHPMISLQQQARVAALPPSSGGRGRPISLLSLAGTGTGMLGGGRPANPMLSLALPESRILGSGLGRPIPLLSLAGTGTGMLGGGRPANPMMSLASLGELPNAVGTEGMVISLLDSPERTTKGREKGHRRTVTDVPIIFSSSDQLIPTPTHRRQHSDPTDLLGKRARPPSLSPNYKPTTSGGDAIGGFGGDADVVEVDKALYSATMTDEEIEAYNERVFRQALALSGGLNQSESTGGPSLSGALPKIGPVMQEAVPNRGKIRQPGQADDEKDVYFVGAYEVHCVNREILLQSPYQIERHVTTASSSGLEKIDLPVGWYRFDRPSNDRQFIYIKRDQQTNAIKVPLSCFYTNDVSEDEV